MNSLHTRHTCQRALAAFISSVELQMPDESTVKLANYPGTFNDPETGAELVVPVGVYVSCGEIDADGNFPPEWQQFQIPAIIVNATRSESHTFGFEICDVAVMALTTVEESGAPGMVDARAGFLEALFSEDALESICEMLSAPGAAVQGFTAIGIERDGTVHEQREERVLSGVSLKVSCQATG